VTHNVIPARHRADGPASTPLTHLTDRVSSAVASAPAARGGLVLAVSSGLVAGAALPASAGLTAAHRPQSHLAHLAHEAAAAHRAHVAHLATLANRRAAGNRASAAHQAHLAHLVHRAAVANRAAVKRAAARRASAAAARARNRTAVSRSASRSYISRGAAVVSIASRYLGVPYMYGGASPRGFDCSGLTLYVFHQLGVQLPRSAAAQYAATRRIPRSQAVPGDLVFYFTGGRVTHTGIYLGGNMMLAAPHTGTRVRKQPIYSANVAFGRV
jgi:peptidoglycan DL-endopeptidase CwlO